MRASWDVNSGAHRLLFTNGILQLEVYSRDPVPSPRHITLIPIHLLSQSESQTPMSIPIPIPFCQTDQTPNSHKDNLIIQCSCS